MNATGDFHERRVPQSQAFLAAVQFLTRVPVPAASAGDADFFRAALAQGAIYFPLVGGVVGLVAAGMLLGFLVVLPVSVAVVAALACEALLTGALHEDAVADTCDALGGGWTREQVLQILKDSRHGTYGVLGLGLGVAGRGLALVELANHSWTWCCLTWIAGAALGRWTAVWMTALLPPVGDRPTQAGIFAAGESSPVKRILLSGLTALPFTLPWFAAAPATAAIAMIGASIAAAAYSAYIYRRLGGTTGDLLGCGCFLVQLSVVVLSTSALGG